MSPHTEELRVIVPQHAQHQIEDSVSGRIYLTNAGLAFTIGVAVMEAGLTRDSSRIYYVQHPNGVPIYIVAFIGGQVVTTKVGA